MKLPDKFEYGRFKLESFYVLQTYENKFAVIINDINLIVLDAITFFSASKVYYTLISGEGIKVKLIEDGHAKIYLVKILNKEWVEFEKI